MKPTPPPGEQPPGNPAEPIQEASLASRFRLALQDEHQEERPGYDPYERTSARSSDVWRNKPKRS